MRAGGWWWVAAALAPACGGDGGKVARAPAAVTRDAGDVATADAITTEPEIPTLAATEPRCKDVAPAGALPAAEEATCAPLSDDDAALIDDAMAPVLARVADSPEGAPTIGNGLEVGCPGDDGRWPVTGSFVPKAGFTGGEGASLPSPEVHATWMVGRTGKPQLRAPYARGGWAVGPRYDFDGDGTVESSEVREGGGEYRIRIAFDRGANQVEYRHDVDPWQRPAWVAWHGAPVLVFTDAFEETPPAHFSRALEAVTFDRAGARDAPDVATALWLSVACGRPATQPVAAPSTTSDEPAVASDPDPFVDGLFAAGFARPAGACADPAPDVKARALASHLRAITDVTTQRGLPVTMAPTFDWACAGPGRWLLVVGWVEGAEDTFRGARNQELWLVAAAGEQQLEQQRTLANGEEWDVIESFGLVGAGDLDGDGVSDPILARFSHEVGSLYEHAALELRLGEQGVPLFEDGGTDGLDGPFIVRAPDGRRDAVVKLAAGLHDRTSWDWEHHPPTIYVLDKGAIRALPKAAIARLISGSKSVRKALMDRSNQGDDRN